MKKSKCKSDCSYPIWGKKNPAVIHAVDMMLDKLRLCPIFYMNNITIRSEYSIKDSNSITVYVEQDIMGETYKYKFDLEVNRF